MRRAAGTSTRSPPATSWTPRWLATPRRSPRRAGDRTPSPGAARRAVGAAGYACAARELADQCDSRQVSAPRTVVVATGSGGTQAGLVAGQVGFGLPWRVLGASVSRPAARRGGPGPPRGSRLCGAPAPWPSTDVRRRRGPRLPWSRVRRRLHEDRVSARLALHHEGLLLDDYYGAKAMSLLRDGARRRRADTGRVLAHRRRRGGVGGTRRGGTVVTGRPRRSGPPRGSAAPGAGGQRVRAGERRRAVPARRSQPRRHRARAGPAAPRHRPGSPAARDLLRLLLEVHADRRRGLPLRPASSVSRTTPGSASSSSGSATSPAGCTPADPGARRPGSRCGSTSDASCSSSSTRWCAFARRRDRPGRPARRTR